MVTRPPIPTAIHDSLTDMDLGDPVSVRRLPWPQSGDGWLFAVGLGRKAGWARGLAVPRANCDRDLLAIMLVVIVAVVPAL